MRVGLRGDRMEVDFWGQGRGSSAKVQAGFLPYRESRSHCHGIGIWKGWMVQQQPLNSFPIPLQTEGLIPQTAWGIVFTSQAIPHGEHDGYVHSFIPLIFYIPHEDSYGQAAVLGAKEGTQIISIYPLSLSPRLSPGYEEPVSNTLLYIVFYLHLPTFPSKLPTRGHRRLEWTRQRSWEASVVFMAPTPPTIPLYAGQCRK